MESRAEREEIYKAHAETLDAMVKGLELHEHNAPGCNQAPLCMGPEALIGYQTGIRLDHRFPIRLVLVAVGELSRMRRKADELERRLEVQRGITGDTLKALSEMEKRATVAEESEQVLAAELDNERTAHAQTLAELTQWEESADLFAPRDPVIDP